MRFDGCGGVEVGRVVRVRGRGRGVDEADGVYPVRDQHRAFGVRPGDAVGREAVRAALSPRVVREDDVARPDERLGEPPVGRLWGLNRAVGEDDARERLVRASLDGDPEVARDPGTLGVVEGDTVPFAHLAVERVGVGVERRVAGALLGPRGTGVRVGLPARFGGPSLDVPAALAALRACHASKNDGSLACSAGVSRVLA